ncbi:hypothetical protein GCM10010232_43180 [Streptomyces amakusaensis]|uniref:Uncharacterized protein n=1 Tax=Streptomyces amakusaensis TaxID=67271 RepID=A0ABW0AG23_9ACTN
MLVEFLTDEQAAGYAAFHGAPSRTEFQLPELTGGPRPLRDQHATDGE